MSRSKALACCVLFAAAVSAVQAQLAPPPPEMPVADKPFMLFVTPLLPPEGAERSGAFSAACFKHLKQYFDSTTFQPILVDRVDMVQRMSNQKKDIIVMADTTDCYLTGPTHDTLVVWIRYKVGLLHGRVDIPYPKGREADLPPLIASGIYRSVRNEFTGVLEIEGGPPGMTIMLVEGVSVMPPRTMLFPPGDYYVTSYYPDFPPRLDTIVVFQGRKTKKRILMLP